MINKILSSIVYDQALARVKRLKNKANHARTHAQNMTQYLKREICIIN